MRLTSQQQQHIVSTVHEHVGSDAVVSLFGSRLNGEARGGDVDLLVEVSRHVPLLQKAALKLALEAAIGLPVDVVLVQAGHALTPFQALAKFDAQPLAPAST